MTTTLEIKLTKKRSFVVKADFTKSGKIKFTAGLKKKARRR